MRATRALQLPECSRALGWAVRLASFQTWAAAAKGVMLRSHSLRLGARLGARLRCPGGDLRAPAASGRRSLVSCIDRKALPGVQVFGTGPGPWYPRPRSALIPRGGRHRGHPWPGSPPPAHRPRAVTLSYPPGWPRPDLAISDLSPPVAPVGLLCYAPPPPYTGWWPSQASETWSGLAGSRALSFLLPTAQVQSSDF